MNRLRQLVDERLELAEQAARIVENMRQDVRIMDRQDAPKQAVKMTRISELSPEEQAKVIRIR